MSNNRALVSPFAKGEPASAESGPFVKKASAGATPAPLEPPTLLGRYALFGQIGAGGMGVVHLGRLLGSGGFERAVAIKRVHPSLSDDDKFVTMFREELRLLARVRHQNVIAALDVLDVDDELLLVMEYVHGESLAALLQKSSEAGQPLALETAVSIACGVLKGLHAAHVATSPNGEPLGIIHRDVSPHNVLVGCDGFPRVLDFGVAKSAGSRQLTRVGELRGKPGYVSPEQIRGEKLTARADIYALSVVLWEMLAGRRLFGARSLAQTIEDILGGSIPPFGAVCEEPISENLEAIVRRGLSTNPDDRFESARDMALALEAEVRPVSPEVIGAWVEATAPAALADRARQLAWCETCPLTEEEITRIGPPPKPVFDEPWEPRAKTPTPPSLALTPAPRSAPPASHPSSGSSRPSRLPRAESVRPERPEMMTRELPLDQLIQATPASTSLGGAPPPLVPPGGLAAAPEASSTRRQVLFGVAGALTLLVGANTISNGAVFHRLFGTALPGQRALSNLTPSPPPSSLEPPPVAAKPTPAPNTQPTISADALPLEGKSRAPQPAPARSAKPQPPAASKPAAQAPAAPPPASPGVRKAAPAAKRPAPSKPKASPDGF
jgi:serine/threonine-protein kinase